MIVDEHARIRVVRALLGLDCKAFASRLGVHPATLTNWEKGRSGPNLLRRRELGKLCQENGIAFSPSGMPFPVADCIVFKQTTNQGE